MGLNNSSIHFVEYMRWKIFLRILNKSKGSISLGIDSIYEGVRTRMFCLIIYLRCFDPCVLFYCLVFCSVSSSTERG